MIGPDGPPASGAEVALLTVEHGVRLSGHSVMGSREDRLIVPTDASGTFRFPSHPGAHSVAVVRKDGFGILRLGAARESMVVPLKPWGLIEGVVDLVEIALGEAAASRLTPSAVATDRGGVGP